MNKSILIGRLTKDPELKFTAGKGAANTTFTIAIDDGFGENKKTNYIPIVVWGKSAESAANCLTKGSQVGISGKIQTRSYESKDGVKKYVTEVVADAFGGVEFLGGKGQTQNQDTSGSNNFGNMNQDLESRFDGELEIDNSDDPMPF